MRCEGDFLLYVLGEELLLWVLEDKPYRATNLAQMAAFLSDLHAVDSYCPFLRKYDAVQMLRQGRLSAAGMSDHGYPLAPPALQGNVFKSAGFERRSLMIGVMKTVYCN